MERDLISVIVPIYKTEKYLRRCVESILIQTYKKLEIILVDDGSPDKCPKICDEYAKKDDRIKVIHKENGGLASARNAGLDIATGCYISTVDSDDWIECQTYETVMVIMQRHNPDLIKWGYYKVSGKNKRIPKKINYTSGLLYGDDKEKFLLDTLSSQAMGNNVVTCLFKREIIVNKRLHIPENISMEEDLYFLTSYLLNCNNVYILPNVFLYNYFQNQRSITKSYSDKYRDSILIAVKEMKQLLKKTSNSSENLYKAYMSHLVETIFYLIMIIEKSNKPLSEKEQELKEFIMNPDIRPYISNLPIKKYSFYKVVIFYLVKKGFYKTTFIIMNLLLFMYKLKNIK
ncbi:MAG: glycosyltransferase family 2 protein [Endomicrobiaceae bacterium]|nr:glycosyltransferase family 2 protein [Endomicrobiaceae bacterium]